MIRNEYGGRRVEWDNLEEWFEGLRFGLFQNASAILRATGENEKDDMKEMIMVMMEIMTTWNSPGRTEWNSTNIQWLYPTFRPKTPQSPHHVATR